MASYSTPIPGVPQYGQAALAAKTAYGNALARINQRRGSLLRGAGFAGDIDSESGVVRNVRVDGSSVYGGLQQLNRSQAMRDEAARYAGIERGLGSGGGLAAQMRNQERFEFGREDANFAQQLTESLAGLQDDQNQAGYARDAALYQAQLDAARMAIQNGDFNQADLGGEAISPSESVASPVGGAAGGRPYNPRAYVPGGAPLAVAKAIQARGYAAAAPKRSASPAYGYVRGGAPANVAKATQRINNALRAAQAASKKKGGR